MATKKMEMKKKEKTGKSFCRMINWANCKKK